jgi:hypothetical protein
MYNISMLFTPTPNSIISPAAIQEAEAWPIDVIKTGKKLEVQALWVSRLR